MPKEATMKKLNLKELEVSSFTTTLEKLATKHLGGSGYGSACGGDCGEDDSPTGNTDI